MTRPGDSAGTAGPPHREQDKPSSVVRARADVALILAHRIVVKREVTFSGGRGERYLILVR